MRSELMRFGAVLALLVPGCDAEEPADADDTGAETGDTGGDDDGDDDDGSLTTGITAGDPDGDGSGSSDGEPGDETEGEDEGEDEGKGVELRQVELAVDGVETLTGGFHYELWAIIDDAPATVGKFNVDGGGIVVDLDGIAIPDALFDAGRDLRETTDFVITIEAAGDVDILPGVSKYLAGPLDGEMSEMIVGHEGALGDDFTDIAGQFILATPTDGPDTNETAGVWWLDLSIDPPAPGLVLPELPEGWEYEGWAVLDGAPVTTGRFRSVDQMDFDGRFSGPNPGPMVPGEDFLVDAPDGLEFPADLRGQVVVITVEPEPDDSAAPFTLKPLLGEVSPAAATHQTLPMTAQADTFPTATAHLVE